MTQQAAKLLKFAAKLAVTVVLLAWVFSRLDLEQFSRTLKEARWELLGPVWAATVAGFWVSSVKMKLLLDKLDCRINTSKIMAASAVSMLYGMIMPGPLNTGVKWYILRKDTRKGSQIFSAMVYNQLSEMVVMVVVGLAALIITNPAALLADSAPSALVLSVVCAGLIIAVVAATVLLLHPRTGGKVIKIMMAVLRPLPEKLRIRAQEPLEDVAAYQALGWRFHLLTALITLAGFLLGGVLAYILAAKAANISIPAAVLVWISVLVFGLGRLPVSIANLGLREITLIGILPLYGVDSEAALLMSMVIFSNYIVMAVIGAACQIAWALSGNKIDAGKIQPDNGQN